MQRITVQLKSIKALQLLRDLEEINIIKLIGVDLNGKSKKSQLLSLKPKRKAKNETFLSLAGIWEERNITLKQIREKA